ncbi:hypothetical protein D3C85_1480950 [compost metagenome]
MEKRSYYINVGTGEVLEDSTALNYEFEISATEDDIAKLQELFEEIDNTSQANFATSHFPFFKNDAYLEYDYYLTEVYRTLHRLGSEQTKRHIETMNVLENGI